MESQTHLEFRQSVLTDNDECLFFPAVAVNITSVDVKPEGVDVNPAILMRPHEGIAGDVLHLEQGVDHGQLVGDAELLVNINVGRILCLSVEIAQIKWLPEVGLGNVQYQLTQSTSL